MGANGTNHDEQRLCVSRLAKIAPTKALKAVGTTALAIVGMIGATASVIAIGTYRVESIRDSQVALGLAGLSWWVIGLIVTLWQIVRQFRPTHSSSKDWTLRRVGIGLSLGLMAAAAPLPALLIVHPTTDRLSWLWIIATLLAICVWALLNEEHRLHADQTPPTSSILVDELLILTGEVKPRSLTDARVPLLVFLVVALAVTFVICEGKNPWNFRLTTASPTTTSLPAKAIARSPTTSFRVDGGSTTSVASVSPPSAAPRRPCEFWGGRGVTDPQTGERMRGASESGAAEAWDCIAGLATREADCWVQTFRSDRALLIGRKYAAGVVGDSYLERLRADLGTSLCGIGETPTNRMDFADGRGDLVATVDASGRVMSLYGRPEKHGYPVVVDPAVLDSYGDEVKLGRGLVPVAKAERGGDGVVRQRFRNSRGDEIVLTASKRPSSFTISELFAATTGASVEDLPSQYRIP